MCLVLFASTLDVFTTMKKQNRPRGKTFSICDIFLDQFSENANVLRASDHLWKHVALSSEQLKEEKTSLGATHTFLHKFSEKMSVSGVSGCMSLILDF